MSFLETNLERLEKIQPALAEELRRIPPSRHIQLTPIDHGDSASDAVIVVGLPSTDSWRTLLRNPSTLVLIAHTHLPDIRAYLTVMDLPAAMEAGRISFAVGEEGVLQLLNDLFGTLYRRKVLLYGPPDLPGHREAMKEMQFFDTLCASNRATLDQFAEEWQNNVSGNLRDFLSGPFLEAERGIWDGGEAVVVAAGPSVDDADLPAVSRAAPVMACDTAVPSLVMRGVSPDLIVTLDSSISNQTYLKNLPPEIYEKSILCATPLVNRSVYLPFKHVLFYSYGHPTLDHLRECGVPFDPVATGGSVALTAVDIARLLGARRAYLLGFDFQFYPFRTHARGTGTALRGIQQITRIRPMEQYVYEYQKELDPTVTRGQTELSDGKKGRTRDALTDKKFQKWREWLELYVKNNDMEIYQMSKTGVPIAGVRFGNPSGGRPASHLRLNRRPVSPDLYRELKFLAKEIEMASAAPPNELARRVAALPRVSKCLGYVLAWLSDKPADDIPARLRDILNRFRSGIQDVVGRQGV